MIETFSIKDETDISFQIQKLLAGFYKFGKQDLLKPKTTLAFRTQIKAHVELENELVFLLAEAQLKMQQSNIFQNKK